MEKLSIKLPAKCHLPQRVQLQNGVVSSGDLEVVFESNQTDTLEVKIKSSVDNSSTRWQALFNRIEQFNELPAGVLLINDFGASPGVARLRIEQVLDEASHDKE